MSDDLHTNPITWDQPTFDVGDTAELTVGGDGGTGPIYVEGEKISDGVVDDDGDGGYNQGRYIVSLTESMGDYLEWSTGDVQWWVELGGGDEPDPHRGTPPSDDASAGSVDSAPKRGTSGGPENTHANEQAAYEDVPRNENGAPQGAPSPSTYRELANWDWVPDAIPSSGRRAAGLLAAGIVALVVLPVFAASGSSSSSTSAADGGDR